METMFDRCPKCGEFGWISAWHLPQARAHVCDPRRSVMEAEAAEDGDSWDDVRPVHEGRSVPEYFAREVQEGDE